MSILKGSRGWFDSRGIRCICESPIDNERILISDEVSMIEMIELIAYDEWLEHSSK